MSPTLDWHGRIASQYELPAQAADQLRDAGFVVLTTPELISGANALSRAYDNAVATADLRDVHTGKTGSSVRVDDLVNRGAAFDWIYTHSPVLAACVQVIGEPFKLSGMRARTLNPNAPAEMLHVDVEHGADGWPLLGCILMIDAFTRINGATRFVPGSHLRPQLNPTSMPASEDEVLACGPAGSMIIFNGSVRHGYGANLSAESRRSVQLHFVPRRASATRDSHVHRMREDTLNRVSDLAKYVLGVS
jgi:hypothetical protein